MTVLFIYCLSPINTMRTKLPDVRSLLRFSIYLAFFFFSQDLIAQDRCGSIELLEKRFKAKPALKVIFDNRQAQLQRIIQQRVASGMSLKTAQSITIPVVFHVVLNRQSLVTDAQIQAQLDTLNLDYAGQRHKGDPRILAEFQKVYGESGIQFCLAQRNPNDEPSTGIDRVTTTKTSFSNSNDDVKHSNNNRGGADIWDPARYFNVWICSLSNSILGYATFPDDGVPDEQGVVIHYGSLPGGSTTGFNYGKTLTHETGHYFDLYHIWGDDNGSCSGTDYIADTPNQGNSTTTQRTGIVTDNCTTTTPGIMYQNYMDYTPDASLLMFTAQQVAHMEETFSSLRSSLGTSNACTPVNLKNKDASIKAILSPDQRLCSNTFIPQVTLRNQGSETLTSVTINAQIDNGTITRFTWTGSLATYTETAVTLPSLTTPEGNHVLTIYTSNPNGTTDEETSNDALSLDFMYYAPVAAPVTESFESNFLPVGWDIVNADGGNTWEKTLAGAKTGSASVRMVNFSNLAVGEKDYLRSPTVNIASTDSAFVSFQVAAATYTSVTTQNNVWDTLQVLISTDCGKTYTSIYKKWGSTLITRSAATRTVFQPTASEWRREEINISNFISSGNILVAFLNINGNENDLYLDDINIRTVTVNPNLKEAGFLVTPNPTDGAISVQFYPHPSTLKGIYIYNTAGQLVDQREITGGVVATNIYDFDLSNISGGLYIVKAVFTDRVMTKKFVKVK